MKAREVLPAEIKRLGGRIDVVPAYKTVRPKKEAEGLKGLLREGRIDVVTFTSSSTVTNFLGMFKKGEGRELLKSVRVACIGPITAATAGENGIRVDIMPRSYTVAGLTEAMVEFFRVKP